MKKTLTVSLLMLSLFSAAVVRAQSASNNKNEYGKNLLTISPIAIMERGIAVGLTYERALDDKGIIQLSLPVFFTFNNFDDDSYGYSSGSNGGYTWFSYTNNPRTYFSAYPGIKIYPTGAFGMVRYGIGPSLAVTYGKTNEDVYNPDPNGNIIPGTYDINRFSVGMMINNSLNINITPKLYMGTDLGLGISYVNRLNGQTDGVTGLVRASFSFGFRF